MDAIGRKLLSFIVALPAILFLVIGVRWLVNPSGIAPDLGLTLETGLGLSSQIGDLSAFFMVAGLCTLIGLVSQQRVWFYPPMMLLLFAAVGRTVAWIVHGADFAPQIVFEIVVAGLFFAGSRFCTKPA